MLQAKRRLEWCKAYLSYTAADWDRIVFSDEYSVRCCKPSDLTYTIELEKQKLNSFEKFIRLKTNLCFC